jgi:hypothetical protein
MELRRTMNGMLLGAEGTASAGGGTVVRGVKSGRRFWLHKSLLEQQTMFLPCI